MQLFNLVDLAKMGDYHETYHQAYWGKTDEEKAVKFNSSNREIVAPCTIMAEETTAKTSAKGTPYLQLKKVKVAERSSEGVEMAPESSTPAQNSQLDRIESQLQEIDSKLDKLMGADL